MSNNLKMSQGFINNILINNLVNFMNPWNTQNRICLNSNMKKKLLTYYKKLISLNTHKRLSWINNNPIDDDVKSYFQNIYNDGYGFKIIARELNLSYSRLRTLFKHYLKMDVRTGFNVVTDELKKFRSKRILGNKNPWYDWPSNPDKFKTNSRGIQGYYITKNNERIWLRSTFEFIFAKWLDNNNINWKYEYKRFTFNNGDEYRPDFFILDDKNNIKQVVEIKGYFKDRVYKVDLLRKQYPSIDVVIIDDMSPYYEQKYEMEKKEWKQLIKLNA